MKIKKSQLENIIKEELKLFRENHGKFPKTVKESQAFFEEEVSLEEKRESEVDQLISKIVQTTGPERFIEMLSKFVDRRAMYDALTKMMERMNIKY